MRAKRCTNRWWVAVVGSLMVLSMSTGAEAATTVTLTEAGTLAEKIAEAGGDDIGQLVVIGPVNGEDFTTMRNLCYEKGVVGIDLSNVRVDGNIIPDGAFYDSDKTLGCPLTSINLPDDVTTIRKEAFFRCSLNKIKLPVALEVVGEKALAETFLEEIVLPASTRFLGAESMITEFQTLGTIMCKAQVPPVCELQYYDHQIGSDKDNAITPFWYGERINRPGVNPAITVYVPMGSKEAYRAAKGWNYFVNFVETDFQAGVDITSLSGETQASTNVRVEGESIIIVSNATEPIGFEVYGTDGRLLGKGLVDNRSVATIPAARGVSIVKVGGEVTKVRF